MGRAGIDAARMRFWAGTLGLLLATASGLAAPQSQPAPVVDEPLGARYSLGLTLWHLGHQAERIRQFHEYLRGRKLSPEKLLPAARLKPPAAMQRLLLEPELLPADQLNGWQVEGDYVTSGATDMGPTLSLPLRVPRAGTYRLWVQFAGRPDARAVTFLKIYRAGREAAGPICQPDEIYAEPPEQAGPAWHDLIVDLPAGDYVLKLGHVTRWWHGPGAYDQRRIDCLYLTEELWAKPPTTEARQALRQSARPAGIQWSVTAPLQPTDRATWRWWQVRPLSWEDSAANPRLFALSRAFWQGLVNELAAKEYSEEQVPDYRAPERQVVFHDTWNLVANPVRARRQIKALQGDVSRKPLGYHSVWHDVASNIAGLSPEAKYDPAGPYAGYGGWYRDQGALVASYGTGTGTVATEVPVATPGRYAVWVRSNPTNLSYTAPWFGTVSVAGKEQFRYSHEGKIPSIWMKMGEVVVARPGKVKVAFTLDGAGAGETYRRIYTLFLVDDLTMTPQGTIQPPWTMERYRQRAAQAGAGPRDKMLLWLSNDPYRRLSQEVWADHTTGTVSWPERPVKGTTRVKELLVPGEGSRAVQVGIRNLTDRPLTLNVQAGPLEGKAGRFPGAVTWRVQGFIPYGPDRQAWTPFFLLRRPFVKVPPLNIAGVWLTVKSRGVPAGTYTARVRFTGQGLPAHVVTLKVRVSAVKPAPRTPILIDGWTQPHEGEAYRRDFAEHGMNVWPGEMSKAEMRRWGIRLLRLPVGSAEDLVRYKALGLDYSDWICPILDEPGGKTEEELKPFLDEARRIKALDPKVRLCFNPSEAATLSTFQILAPLCDFWVPYSLHVFGSHWDNPKKWEIYRPKPWMWYTTPCLWDKTAGDPGIRQAPVQPGNCVGVAFFALNYPWRDQWDTAYEHIADASTMGAVLSRHGPVATVIWEQLGEAAQAAQLAMCVRERLGVKTFDEVKDPAHQHLIREGTLEELIRWLEEHQP